MNWVLIIFRTQVTKKKRPVWPVFPDYLSVSYDYDPIDIDVVSRSVRRLCDVKHNETTSCVYREGN